MDHKVVPLEKIPVDGRDWEHEHKLTAVMEKKGGTAESVIQMIENKNITVPEQWKDVMGPGENMKDAQSFSKENEQESKKPEQMHGIQQRLVNCAVSVV